MREGKHKGEKKGREIPHTREQGVLKGLPLAQGGGLHFRERSSASASTQGGSRGCRHDRGGERLVLPGFSPSLTVTQTR